MSVLWVSLTAISQKGPRPKSVKIKEVPQSLKVIPSIARRILKTVLYACLRHNHVLLT